MSDVFDMGRLVVARIRSTGCVVRRIVVEPEDQMRVSFAESADGIGVSVYFDTEIAALLDEQSAAVAGLVDGAIARARRQSAGQSATFEKGTSALAGKP